MKQSSLDILGSSSEVSAVVEVGRMIFLVFVIYISILMFILLGCAAYIYPDGPVSRAEFEQIQQQIHTKAP